VVRDTHTEKVSGKKIKQKKTNNNKKTNTKTEKGKHVPSRRMSFPFDRIGLDSVFEKDDGAAAAAAASAAALLSSGRCHPNGRHESADRT